MKKTIFDKIKEVFSSEVKEKESKEVVNKIPIGVEFLPNGNSIGRRSSLDFDPDREASQSGYRSKPFLLTSDQKLMIYLRDPIVSMIVHLKIAQISEFSRPQKNKYGIGFIWERKDGDMDEKDEKIIKFLNEFILRCGIVSKERDEAEENLDFETCLKLIIKDRYIHDAVAIELIRNYKDEVTHFLPVSSGTIYLAKKDQISEETGEKIKYVQVIGGNKRVEFTSKELVLKFGNPTNEIFTQGYSIGELDLLISTITSRLNADTFNRSIYERGFVSQGIINLKGEVEEEQIQSLRRSWYNQGNGPSGMNKTPIINNPDGMEFIKLDFSHRDMEYSSYMDYLIKIICGVFLVSPEEINFSSGGSSHDSSRSYSNVEKKMGMSRDRGLKPLLRFVENIINEDILCYLSEDIRNKYEFKFVGFDSDTKEEELARNEKEARTYKFINEIRKENGLDPIEGGDIILDSIYLQWYDQYSKRAKSKQQQEQNQSPNIEESLAPLAEESPEQSKELPWESPEQSKELPWESPEQSKELPWEKSLKVKTPTLMKVEIYKK